MMDDSLLKTHGKREKAHKIIVPSLWKRKLKEKPQAIVKCGNIPRKFLKQQIFFSECCTHKYGRRFFVNLQFGTLSNVYLLKFPIFIIR